MTGGFSASSSRRDDKPASSPHRDKEMNMREIFERLKRRTATQPRLRHAERDWSASWTPRDWADLPTHHPRHDD